MFLRKFDTNFHTVWTLVRCHVLSRNAPTGNTPMQQKRKAFISINLVAAFRKPDKMNVLLHIHVFPQPPHLALRDAGTLPGLLMTCSQLQGPLRKKPAGRRRRRKSGFLGRFVFFLLLRRKWFFCFLWDIPSVGKSRGWGKKKS